MCYPWIWASLPAPKKRNETKRSETPKHAETHLEGGQLVFLDQVIPMCQNQPTNVQVLEVFTKINLAKKKEFSE